MVAIVRSFGFSAVELQNLSRVPTTDELRLPFCPCCGVAVGPPGALRIVGHGLYRRQLLGLPDAPEGVVIFVRRFLCLNCRKTTSVLPEEVHPRRWYAGSAILVALVRYLILGWSAEKVRAALGAAPGSRGWKALERWTKQLLDTLWFWKASELGHVGSFDGVDRSQAAQRLRGFLVHMLVPEPKPPDVSVEALANAARAAVLGTVHAWPERRIISRTA